MINEIVEVMQQEEQRHPSLRELAQGWADSLRHVWGKVVSHVRRKPHAGQRAASAPYSRLYAAVWRIKQVFIAIVGLVVPLAMAGLLSLGVGFFFADFRLPTANVWVIFSYIGGLLVELTAVALLYLASQQFYKQRWWAFGVTFFLYGLFALGSVGTQYLMSDQQLAVSGVQIPEAAIEQVPAMSLLFHLFATTGRAGMLVSRAMLYVLVEIACIFIVAHYEFSEEQQVPAPTPAEQLEPTLRKSANQHARDARGDESEKPKRRARRVPSSRERSRTPAPEEAHRTPDLSPPSAQELTGGQPENVEPVSLENVRKTRPRSRSRGGSSERPPRRRKQAPPSTVHVDVDQHRSV